MKKLTQWGNRRGSLKEPIENLLDKSQSKRILSHISYNSGNLVINEYCTRKLVFKNVDIKDNPEEILLIMANFVRPNIIKEWGKPHLFPNKKYIVLGMGTQATFEDMLPKEYVKTLEPELIEWLKLLADNCVSIGVRGEFTADVLKELGILNVDVVGCPTWFVNGYKQPVITKKNWNSDLKPAVYTCWENYSKYCQDWNHALFTEALKLKDPKFIMQSEFKFLPFKVFNDNIFKLFQYSNFKELNSSIENIKSTFGISKFEIITNSKIRKMFEMFIDVDKWGKFIRTRDFCYGMRIHGSVVAIKNGIPAIPIVPDSRILEMCQLFKIPYLKVSDIESSKFSLQKLYEEADFTEMNKIYPKLLENYISFLNKNDVEHCFHNDV